MRKFLLITLLFTTACKAQTTFGLMPFKLHGSLPTRDEVVLGRWVDSRDMYINRWQYDTIFSLNINHHGIGAEPVPYTPHIRKYKDTLQDIYNVILSLPHPENLAFITIENEQEHGITMDSIYHSEGIHKYSRELRAAAKTFPPDVILTNGGYTLPAQWWYAYKSGDTVFKSKVCPRVNLAFKQPEIDSVEYEMNMVRKLPANFVNNIHIYLTDTAQAEPFIRMINYIKNYTKHDMLSNEFGIWADNILLLKSLVFIARETGMPYVIFLSGDGDTAAKPITIDQVKEAIQ